MPLFEKETLRKVYEETGKFNQVLEREEFKTIAFTATLQENLFILFISLLNQLP